MRILHVNHKLSVGGAENMLLELAAEHKRLGHTVTICSMYGVEPLDAKARDLDLPVVHLNSGTTLTAKIKSLVSYLREHPQDLLHSHWAVWLATSVAGFLTKTPHVHTHHSGESRRTFMEHRAASLFTDKVVVLTPEADSYIKQWVSVPERKLVVISNGINLTKFSETQRTELDGIEPGAPVVGMVARLSPPKDYSTFIRAAKIVLDRFPNVHFVAVGEGRQHLQLEVEKAQLALRNFHFLGNREDVPSILKRMTVNVLASESEGQPIVLIEAMASGCACIASDIPAIRFVLNQGKAGLLVPGKNPEALAEAIGRLLLDEPLRKSLRDNGVHRSLQFSVQDMARDYIHLYCQLNPPSRALGSGRPACPELCFKTRDHRCPVMA
jgi:glycosyltransferase involved in cell wall biosynthesis